jgi:serine protease Do
MNENDYSATSEWYASSRPPKPPKKKRTALKVVLICLCVLLVLGGIGYLAFGSTTKGGSDSSGGVTGSGQLPDDWRSYLDSVYSQQEITKAQIDLKQTDYTGSFKMSLVKASEKALTLQEIYDKCLPSIVSITAYASDDSGTSWGTGVVMSEDGLIITNTHVIESCDSVTVTLSDGTEYKDAQLIGADSQSDITILKIDAKGLTPAEFGDSSQLQVGDSVAAIGNPLGKSFTGTMTNGIVSAINRGVTYNGHVMTLIQTNAAINEGNSGGPLVDMYGHVIGITNMKMMSSYSSIEGIGFAIPTSGILTVADDLLSGGEVTGRPSIGITVGAVTEAVADHYNIPNGLYISSVSKGSDAEAQGVKAGDILTAVNGQTVTTTSQVSDIKNACKVGDSLKLTIWRDGKTFDVSVKLVEASKLS